MPGVSWDSTSQCLSTLSTLLSPIVTKAWMNSQLWATSWMPIRTRGKIAETLDRGLIRLRRGGWLRARRCLETKPTIACLILYSRKMVKVELHLLDRNQQWCRSIPDRGAHRARRRSSELVRDRALKVRWPVYLINLMILQTKTFQIPKDHHFQPLLQLHRQVLRPSKR